MIIGEKSAERVKIEIGAVYPQEKNLETIVRGRDLLTGLPREELIRSDMIVEALSKSSRIIAEGVQSTIERTPPELIVDIIERGIMLAGGGALLRGIDKLIMHATGIPVYIIDDPLTVVVRGTGIILEDLDNLKEVLVNTEEIIPPQ